MKLGTVQSPKGHETLAEALSRGLLQLSCITKHVRRHETVSTKAMPESIFLSIRAGEDDGAVLEMNSAPSIAGPNVQRSRASFVVEPTDELRERPESELAPDGSFWIDES